MKTFFHIVATVSILVLEVFSAKAGIADKQASGNSLQTVVKGGGYNVTFIVTSQNKQVSGTVINLFGYGEQVTDAQGIAVYSNVQPSDSVGYTASAYGYQEFTDSIRIIDSDIVEQVNLDLLGFIVTFKVTDSNEQPLKGATVEFQGYSSKITDNSGLAVFNNVLPSSGLNYTVTNFGYQSVSGVLTVGYSDVNQPVQLDPAFYAVTFHISKGTTPIANAVINLSGYGTKTSDGNGTALFDSVAPKFGNIYTVDIPGYSQWLGAVDVIDHNVTENVVFSLPSYNVYFIVKINQDPLSGAVIYLDGYGMQTTNKSGLASFINVQVSDRINYTVTADNLGSITDSIRVVDDNVYEYVVFTGIGDQTVNPVVIYPNPNQGRFIVQLKSTALLTVYSIDGKELLRRNYQSGKQEIELVGIKPGTYLIKVDEKNETQFGKLIIQHP